MHLVSFIGVAVPAVVVVYISCLALVYSLATHFDQFERYYLTALVSQFAVIAFRVSTVARKSAKYQADEKKRGRRLPESPPATFADKFFVHIAEEAVKFSVLAICATWIASDRNTFPSYALVVAAVFAGNKLVCNFMTFSPLNYSIRYKKFSRALRNYEGKSCIDTGSGVVPGLKSDKVSVASEPSLNVPETATLVSSSSDEISGPRFKLDLFEDPVASPSKSGQGIRIHRSMESLTAAYSQKVERLLSISPGDTAYLDYNPFLGVSDSVCDSSTRTRTDAGFESLSPYLGTPILSGSPQKSNFSTHCLSSSRSTLFFATQRSLPKRKRSWWRWLFPWCNKKEKKRPSVRKTRRAERAHIKKKLSTFTLNSDLMSPYEKSSISGAEGEGEGETETTSLKSARSWYSYGTMDLESQALDTGKMVANSHTYYEFAKFANVYLDVWASSLHGVLRQMDPAYIRFGVPIFRLPISFFIVYEASMCMWQTTSTLILALPFFGYPCSRLITLFAIALLLVAKCFCHNYLHGQSTMSYKHSIGAEYVVNFVLCVGAYTFIYLFTS